MCILCMQVPPPYVGKVDPEVFHAMVDYMTGPEFKKKHDARVAKRLKMHGGSHSQGSVKLAVCIQKKVRKCIL